MDLPPSHGPTLQVAQAFITLADTLVTGFDVIDFMHGLAEQCVRLLGVDAAGLLFAAPGEKLRLVGASSEQSRLLELFQLQTDQGPCLDCFATVSPFTAPTWPRRSPCGAGPASQSRSASTDFARSTRCPCGCATR
ncbi:hypothetical protein AB0H88_04860 [Nonomuraea sp. NPDC050680]|uniref:hypothetical protein n=1 Tax=Nonomuraea sp. NPDC050680 TaxID=3154630 RepID=UPI0033BFF107